MQSGIYAITSPSGGQYIGSAIDFANRWRNHRYLLRKENHHSRALQRACVKYGIDELVFEKVLVCRKEDLIFFEQRAIDILRPKYNSRLIAESQLGFRHSVESKAKNSASHFGKPIHTPEFKASIGRRSIGNTYSLGRKVPLCERLKVSAALKGKFHKDSFESRVTEEQKKEIVNSYLSGIGQVALEKKWKTNHDAIRRILVSAGVVISRSGHTIKRKKKS